ncbi:dynein axonemal heavy chain 5-like [Amia ocellicauda]|uniref:dynein axonemal heavy chain 5-like n=1 Tax=Amia ocellicauda TaxID=2972642 RepID=UPI003464518E
MYELIEDLKRKMKPADRVNLEAAFPCLQPDTKQKTRCQDCLPCSFYNMMGQLCQKNTDALAKCTKLSLDALKQRLRVVNSKDRSNTRCLAAQSPLFRAAIQLEIPNVVIRPSLDDIQSALNRAVNTVLSMAKDIPLWTFAHLQHQQLQVENVLRDTGDDDTMTKQVVLKPLARQLSEHKDISKLVVQLGSIVSALKTDAKDHLKGFSCFSSLWSQDPEERVKEFLESSPTLSEFSAQIASYSCLEAQIAEMPATSTVGSVQLDVEPVKLSLSQECRHWKRAFGAALNGKASADMEEVYGFIDGLGKRLSRPVEHLEDVRGAMAALKEVREAEVRIDMTVGHVEEAFALLNRHELLFRDGNAERVDSLAYVWRKLNSQVGAVRRGGVEGHVPTG